VFYCCSSIGQIFHIPGVNSHTNKKHNKIQDRKFRPGEKCLEMATDLKYIRAEIRIYVPLVMNK
jgi:hypothetical protein